MKVELVDIKHKKIMFNVMICLIVLLIGFVDCLSGAQVEFSILYLVPVLMAATTNKYFGIFISICSALLSLLTAQYLGKYASKAYIYYWDFISHAIVFSLATILRSDLILSRENERELAHTDHLTGAMNLRAFKKQVEAEIYRSERYGCQLTVAYIDVDGFKDVNDLFGHAEGDRLLASIVSTLKNNTRKADVVARVGGDEWGGTNS